MPSKLAALLDGGEVDAALVPIIDVIRSAGRYEVVSDACIGCDGETMTVRIFSQVPPDRITRLRADADSHTSVALAGVIFAELYDRELIIEPFDARRESVGEFEAVLLIGDKVVDSGRSGFAYEIDLGGAWRAHTGLPRFRRRYRRSRLGRNGSAGCRFLRRTSPIRRVRPAQHSLRDRGPQEQVEVR